MSEEKVFNTLTNLGLSKIEAQIYIYLAKREPQKAKDIAGSLKLIKQQVYPAIKKLQSKGMVFSTLEHPARFSAVSFQKMLDLCINAKMEEAQNIQRNMDQLVSDWESIKIKEEGDSSPKFAVIEGRNYIYSRIEQMLLETKKQFSIITSIPNLLRFEQFGLIDNVKNCLSNKIRFRFVTELSENEIMLIKSLLEKNQEGKFELEGRTPDLGQKLKNHILIMDENEALFFIDSLDELKKGDKDSTCLWTNSKTLVQAFSTLFKELWQNSTDIKEKIEEVETGKPTTKTIILSDKFTSEKKFYEVLKSAKNEIFMITTLTTFLELWRNVLSLPDFKSKKVSLKIMVPITVENFQTARKFSEHCDIKHVPESYLGTTLVDDLHLFQFKASIADKKNERIEQFENVFYTTDSEHIEKTKMMINDLWNNAPVLSAVTLNSIINLQNGKNGLNEKPYDVYRRTAGYLNDKKGSLSEKDLLSKMNKNYISSANDPSKDTTFLYGYGARALINPPEHLNLPRMMISVFHCNEQSTFGKENWLVINLPKQTPHGEKYVPQIVIGDNPEAVAWRNRIYKGTPLENHLPLVKEDELQVRKQGNILFAGWTCPISLDSKPLIVPPSCLFFEGYREFGTVSVESNANLLRPQRTEFFGLEAFVTFFHPSSKYSAPGTDAMIFRDLIITSSPPKIVT